MLFSRQLFYFLFYCYLCYIDATGIHSVIKLIDDFNKKGKKIVISHANEHPLSAFKKAGVYKKIGKENFCPNIDAALVRAEELAK